MTEFSGQFETHLTLQLDDAERLEELREWAARHGLKCVHIILDRGECPSQPMLSRWSSGLLSTEILAARALSRQLTADRFRVIRTKIEAAVSIDGVPQASVDVLTAPDGRYFEHHVKLLLETGADRDPILTVAQQHDAHLSRNALRRRPDGGEERFVTQRCHGVGRIEARRSLDALLAALRRLGHPVLEVEEEYVVFDSHAAVDDGWITPREP
jgi:hypothetical protein